MSPSLSSEQRQAIASQGTPLAIRDTDTDLAFLLFAVEMSELRDGSISAAIPACRLYGEGNTPDDAIIAISEAARLLSESQLDVTH